MSESSFPALILASNKMEISDTRRVDLADSA